MTQIRCRNLACFNFFDLKDRKRYAGCCSKTCQREMSRVLNDVSLLLRSVSTTPAPVQHIRLQRRNGVDNRGKSS